MLTFIVPVRHHETLRDWGQVEANLATTLRSIAAQSHPAWRAVIVANRGTPLPAVPAQCDVVRVNYPARQLPDRHTHTAAFYDMVRRDKGLRILAGLIHARPDGFVMFVDFDDLVSQRLAGHCAASPAARGWYFEEGYLYSGDAELYAYAGPFYKFCGTCHILRADLLKLPWRIEEANVSSVALWLGSHYFLKEMLDKAGTPLERLPFAGAIYRIGHGETTSGSPTIAQFIAEHSGGDPGRAASLRRNLCALTPALREEFFGDHPLLARDGAPQPL